MSPHIQTPLTSLQVMLKKMNQSNTAKSMDSDEFANFMDKEDPLRRLRDKFQFPTLGSIPCETSGSQDSPCIYLCGNSLGLKPKQADVYMGEQLDFWGKQGVFMHFNGRIPAALADQPGKEITADIVGASSTSEVTIMNGLTVNLHLLMLAFYKPSGRKNKILIEDHAFPSDRYAVRSLLKIKGVGDDGLLLVKPRPGEDIIRTEDILEIIEKNQDDIALVMLSGVQYYTGQKFDMKTITKAGRRAGCMVGWDLAHAVGNVELKLSEWGVDFAVWCSYKYLNSGAGGIAGAFVHQKHHNNMPDHLEGWWSNSQETRFEMRDKVDPAIGAEAFRLCNPPPWLAALNLASLEIFQEAGMEALLAKQYLLTGYLEYLLTTRLEAHLKVITPQDPTQRGCQLSLVFYCDLNTVHDQIQRRGVVCDVRYPSAMRIAPVPLYNSFKDVRQFVNILEQALEQCL